MVRFATSNGYIYLKQTPALLALEPIIIDILHDQFHAAVSNIIAHNVKLNCFLMKDAGRPLREILKNKFDITLFCKAIDQFTLFDFRFTNLTALFTSPTVLVKKFMTGAQIFDTFFPCIEFPCVFPGGKNLNRKLYCICLKEPRIQFCLASCAMNNRSVKSTFVYIALYFTKKLLKS